MRELPGVVSTVNGLLDEYNTVKASSEQLQRSTMEYCSALSSLISRLSAVLSSSAALEMASSHENLVHCVEEILSDFSFPDTTQDQTVQRAVMALKESHRILITDDRVIQVFRDLESRNYYEEILESLQNLPTRVKLHHAILSLLEKIRGIFLG